MPEPPVSFSTTVRVKGGDVIFEASENVNTLIDFRFQPELKAKPGTNGSKAKRHGKNGEDLIVKVPVGTLIKRGEVTIADLTVHGERKVVAMGGDGGFGNAHFKSSVRQTPRMAEKGEPGDSFTAELELKLLADVGLLGLPNAGKSTFLSVVTNAKPEIANYAFTTLTPNLGVADIDDSSLLIADIPGLIEGAAEGKGNLDQVIDAGYGVCGDLRNGMPVLDEMSRVESLYRFDQGTLFVSAATTHLCPDFAG